MIPGCLSILVTNKCNFNCYYCEFDCKAKGKSLDISLLGNILKQGKKLGIKRVVYDGGEPMMHEHFEDILKLSRTHDYQVGFVTNAWFIPEKIDLLKKYEVHDFWIGIDGDAKTNDPIRRQGSFDRVRESIDLLKKNCMFVALNFLVLKENYQQIEPFIRFAASKNIDAMQVIPLNRFAGRAYKNQVTGLDAREEQYVKDALHKYAHLLDFEIGTSYFCSERVIGRCKYLSFDQLAIDWDGNCQLCALTPDLNMQVPSLKEHSLKNAISQLESINREFVKTREQEAKYWHPTEIYNTCGYCLEKLRSDKPDKSKYLRYDGDLLLTTACPVECDFCIYACSPDGEWMPEKTIQRVAKEYTDNEVGIRISGGEPFYDLNKLARCLDIVLEYQKPHQILVITSGFFATNIDNTKKALKLLKDRHIDTLVVSVDRFHAVPLSNVKNIITESNCKVVLRVTTDAQSYGFMDRIAEIVVAYGLKYEPHYDFGLYGRGELLDPNLRENADEREDYLRKKIVEHAMKLGRSTIINDYEEQSPKRSQRKFAAKFYPTTFPNGNVYGDSQCCRGTFMGNIKDGLAEMMKRFKETLPGQVLLSDAKDCSRMDKYSLGDTCDYCRNQPFDQLPDEAIGRNFVVVDLDKVKLNPNRENLLSFRLTPEQLNRETGERIIRHLDYMKGNNLRFKISRPLPRCVLGPDYKELIEKYDLPRDCSECVELFTYNKGFVNCQGHSLTAENRQDIVESLNKKIYGKCRSCVHYLRNLCQGYCIAPVTE